ncbi:hypothetical protein C2845_PM02G17890 [Panicum miliaceum]|uniref:Uncharacterized protein n=1 Tax=Panicum miliaceum TaxID=4540 RepID=A0A3L6S8P7_PANMI|nr:hypothetical protein C2845_PM02G17890 [Panicum miliaceum]
MEQGSAAKCGDRRGPHRSRTASPSVDSSSFTRPPAAPWLHIGVGSVDRSTRFAMGDDKEQKAAGVPQIPLEASTWDPSMLQRPRGCVQVSSRCSWGGDRPNHMVCRLAVR